MKSTSKHKKTLGNKYKYLGCSIKIEFSFLDFHQKYLGLSFETEFEEDMDGR